MCIEPPGGGNLKYYSWTIDVRVTPVSSGEDKPEASVRHNLPELTMRQAAAFPPLPSSA